MGSSVLALIPARGGSKSIPDKNIRLFCGKPLIAHSIEFALQCGEIDRVIVSTDSAKIAEIALRYGAEVPFVRPAELAQDDSLDLDVFRHALRILQSQENYLPDLVAHLRPTCPIRRPEFLKRALKSLEDCPEADSIRSVCAPSENPFKMWMLEPTGFMQALLQIKGEESFNWPRQKLPSCWWQTANLDVIRTNTILQKNSMTGERILPLFMPTELGIDIDTPADWQRAEQMDLNFF